MATTHARGGKRRGSGRPPASPAAPLLKALDRLEVAVTAAVDRKGGHGISYDEARAIWAKADELTAMIDDLIIPAAADYPPE